MRTIYERFAPLREGEGMSGGGGGDGGQQQQQQQQNGGGQQQQQQFWTRYELPEGMRGQSAEEAYDKLYNGWKGARDKIAAYAPPKDAKEYKFEPGEKIKPFFKGSEADNKLMEIARATAHKLGIPDTHFAPFINGVFEAAVDAGMMPAAFNPQAHIEQIGNLFAADKAGPERTEAVRGILTEAEAFAPALGASLKLSDAGKRELAMLADSAGGIEVLRALKAMSAEKGIQLGGNQQQQGYSWADFDRDVADERYNPFNRKFDKAFREGVDAKMRNLTPR